MAKKQYQKIAKLLLFNMIESVKDTESVNDTESPSILAHTSQYN